MTVTAMACQRIPSSLTSRKFPSPVHRMLVLYPVHCRKANTPLAMNGTRKKTVTRAIEGRANQARCRLRRPARPALRPRRAGRPPEEGRLGTSESVGPDACVRAASCMSVTACLVRLQVVRLHLGGDLRGRVLAGQQALRQGAEAGVTGDRGIHGERRAGVVGLLDLLHE